VLSIIRLGREVRKRANDYKMNSAQITWAVLTITAPIYYLGSQRREAKFYEGIPQPKSKEP
jgi:hypothetical protein